MRRTLIALGLMALLVAQSSSTPAAAQSTAADQKQTFCTLAKWRADRLVGELGIVEPSQASVAAEAAKLSVPITLQQTDFASLRSRISSLANAVCAASTADAARSAYTAFLGGEKAVATQLKAAAQRDEDALKAAAQAIKTKSKDKVKDAAASEKAKLKAELEAQRTQLAKTYKGDELKSKVRAAAQQLRSRGQADLKAQAQASAKVDVDALRAIHAIRVLVAQRLKTYMASGKDEWSKVKAQAQQDLAAAALDRVTAACASAGPKLTAASEQATKMVEELKARSDRASAPVQQAIDAVSAYQTAVAKAQAACTSPSGTNAGRQVHDALQAVQQAGARAKQAVEAAKAGTGT